jgi:membrane fusion protein, multidrug efflux system
MNREDKSPDKEGEAAERRRQFFRRPVVRGVIVVVIGLVVVSSVFLWLRARKFESTDDAFVDTHIVRMAPQIAGRIARVHVNDNQLVRAGQLLVEIDPGDVQSRLDQTMFERTQAETQLNQALTDVARSEAAHAQALSMEASAAAQAKQATQDLQRYKNLQATTPQAVSQAQVDQAEAAARSATAQRNAAREQASGAEEAVAAARAQVASARARIQTLGAQVQQARLNVGYARIVAPMDGHVAQRTIAVGSYVSPGQQILAIVPLQMWITANFKETQLADIRIGQPVSIDIDACPDARSRGHIDSIQRGAGQAFGLLPPENATGNFVKVVQRVPVKIVFDSAPRGCPLGPGMSVIPKVSVH